ncbi:MAG: hypothetical protein JKY56_07150 [Kofleriaceae bacterium]|nr:hypothetical protein [Kofleriaceae bacterium]
MAKPNQELWAWRYSLQRSSLQRSSLLRSSLFSLLLCGAGLAIVVPAVSSCGGSTYNGTGESPASDAEIKVVVLNVFGMT